MFQFIMFQFAAGTVKKSIPVPPPPQKKKKSKKFVTGKVGTRLTGTYFLKYHFLHLVSLDRLLDCV